jgi:hypothetical protein
MHSHRVHHRDVRTSIDCTTTSIRSRLEALAGLVAASAAPTSSAAAGSGSAAGRKARQLATRASAPPPAT